MKTTVDAPAPNGTRFTLCRLSLRERKATFAEQKATLWQLTCETEWHCTSAPWSTQPSATIRTLQPPSVTPDLPIRTKARLCTNPRPSLLKLRTVCRRSPEKAIVCGPMFAMLLQFQILAG